jgi:hypothetical protein
MEEVENGDLDVNQKSEFLGERCQGTVVVGTRFKQIVYTDGGFGWFGVAETDAIVVEFEVIRGFDNFFVAC